jgi:hypothetical protein
VVQLLLGALLQAEGRPALPFQAPLLILHRRDFGLVAIDHGRCLAEHIAGPS